ncbi:MAG: hypothetical protein HHJ15_04050 [Rhodoferax sp.]|uniref:hypothetical protein n=1 Tax=Rhodoferax sp. TaxID=50421 RepID=UPI0017AE8C58|nr:hypothetical protein [Rhodoferax sp.]NMM19123.1 hypothetical protein [Rhodoferax sp.]
MRKTMQVAPDVLKSIQNRVSPKGAKPDGAQMGAVLMFKNCAATLRIAAMKRAATPTTTEANRKALAAALAPQTAGARNAKRLAALTATQSAQNRRHLSQITKK